MVNGPCLKPIYFFFLSVCPYNCCLLIVINIALHLLIHWLVVANILSLCGILLIFFAWLFSFSCSRDFNVQDLLANPKCSLLVAKDPEDRTDLVIIVYGDAVPVSCHFLMNLSLFSPFL